MADPAREVEAKFALDPADRDALVRLDEVAAFRVVGRESGRQLDTYFDTADGRLARLPASLRLRRKARGAVMTFKGAREATSAAEAHVASRLEDEISVTPEYAERVSLERPLPEDPELSPLRRVRALIGDGPLLATAQLDNERVALVLQDASGATLELAIDHVVGSRLQDGRRVEWDEVELETKGADRASLLALADALRAVAPSLRPNHVTKLERVLGSRGDAGA